MHRIHRDWCGNVDALMLGKEKEATLNKMRKELTESLIAIDGIFAEKPYFMSDDFTLVDCCVAAILWRLPVMGIELQKSKAGNLLAYSERLFRRDSFQASLSDAEREMRL
jgi:RNA polymerase-associated protein